MSLCHRAHRHALQLLVLQVAVSHASRENETGFLNVQRSTQQRGLDMYDTGRTVVALVHSRISPGMTLEVSWVSVCTRQSALDLCDHCIVHVRQLMTISTTHVWVGRGGWRLLAGGHEFEMCVVCSATCHVPGGHS